MKIFQLLLITALAISCGTGNQQNNAETSSEEEKVTSPTLTQLWSTDTTLRTPESVLYDTERNLIYVANVNMNPWEKDGNGFISRLDLQGNVIDLKWVENLNGPKGMGLMDDKLYIADIDRIVEVDAIQGTTLQDWTIEGTPTLNDISIRGNTIYISGSDSQKIFKLENGEVTTILEGDLGRPNGLFAEADRILMLTSSSSQLESIDYTTMSRTTLTTDLGHGDGIVPAGDGSYLASSWRGQLFFIDADMKRHVLLDTEAEKINAADIDYSIEKNLLLVPTFFDNRVVAYSLSR